MNISIGPLEGIFDGYDFHQGPLYVQIEDEKIIEISDSFSHKVDIDGTGKFLSVPFHDGHTHLIFGGERFFELPLKLQGKSYSDILAAGGGIKYTVRETRSSDYETLKKMVLNRLDAMLAHGTTVVEAKSGYGLSTEHEIRLLEILNEVNQEHPITIYPTFGAAHVIPEEKNRATYISEIIDEMLPIVVKKKLATSTDVFCDRGAFTVDETIEIFEKSKSNDLPVRVHAEELEYTGIAKIASEKFQLLSADHLLLANQEDFEVIKANKTTAMFMPLAPIGLFTPNRPRGWQSVQPIIGLGSDFNPNNWVISLQTAIRMGVFTYQMSPIQAMQAATSGSYQGITGNQFNRLETGSQADFILIQAKTPEEFVSKFGQNLVSHIFIDGHLIHENNLVYV